MVSSPQASHEFRALMSDLAMLRDNNIRLQDKVEKLETEVTSLKTAINDLDAKILVNDLAKLYIHYFIELRSGGGKRIKRTRKTNDNDHESKESAPDKILNWERITDELSTIRNGLEDNEISLDEAEKKRSALRSSCHDVPVDVIWEITSSRHALAHRKTRTVQQQKQLLREANKYSWPKAWPAEWLQVKDAMLQGLHDKQDAFHYL